MFYIIYSEATVTLLFLKNCVFYLILIDLGVNTVFILFSCHNKVLCPWSQVDSMSSL